MAYSKTTWVDRVVAFANRYTKSGETTTNVTLVADPGTVTTAGTPISAANLNKIEQGIADALRKDGGESMTGPIMLTDANVKLNRIAGDVFLNSASGFTILSANAIWTGTVWNRLNTGVGASRIEVRWGDFVLYTAASGANPITWSGPYKLWSENNDGSGSGLDADLLGGLNSLAFVKADGTVPVTGQLQFPLAAGTYGYIGNFGSPTGTEFGFSMAGNYLLSVDTATQRAYVGNSKNLVWDAGTLRDNSGTLEFYTSGAWRAVGGVKSVQRGTVATATPYVDVTISAVVMAKTFCNFPTSMTGSVAQTNRMELINTTTVRIYSASTATFTWEVVESY